MKTIRRIAGIALLTVALLIVLGAVYVLLSMNATEESRQASVDATPLPYEAPTVLTGTATQDVSRYFPYPSVVLSGEKHTLAQECAYDERMQGRTCRVVERTYPDSEGCTVTVRSATPSAYLTAYADCTVTQELYAMPDGRAAQYLTGDARECLLVRDGEVIYSVETADGKDALLRAATALGFE